MTTDDILHMFKQLIAGGMSSSDAITIIVAKIHAG